MRRGLVAFVAMCISSVAVYAQQPVAARAHVVAYYDEAGIEKDAYRESPYFQELGGSWRQRHTDTSVVYSRQLDVEKNWKDYHVYLNVRCGRAVRVLVNGKEAGYGDDSRHWNEFLLDAFLRYGRANELSIEAMKDSRGALLEDTALRVGLNGDPYLLFKSDPNIADMTLQADYDAATTTGNLSLTTTVFCGKRKGKCYVEVLLLDPRGHEFDRMGRWVVFNGKNEELVDISRSWSGVAPWNAESPSLYTAIVRLRNEKMEEEELVGQRFGFRRVEVKDGELRLNGKAITLKGVTYGIEHTEGHASRERMRRDVLAMKQNNINAVRTSRFSPMEPYFYELCDRYGLYVVADANLMPLSEHHRAVATEQEYIPLFQQRVEHLYGKFKNYTSIIAWSLGNTSDNGVCMSAAYKWLKGLDKTRPVIFAGAGHAESTDIIAPSHPSRQALGQALSKQGGRPFVMLASVRTDDFADLEGLWTLCEERHQLQGGFVDAWPLPQAMLSDLKHLYSPFSVRLSKMTPDEGEFIVTNHNDFSDFSRYALEYNIYTNLRPSVVAGDLPVAIAGGGSEKVGMLIPQLDLQPGEEVFIRFTLSNRHVGKQRAEVGTVVFALPQKAGPRRMLVNNGAPLPAGLEEDVSLRRELFFMGHEDWTAETVDRMVRRPDTRTLCVDNMIRYTAPDGSVMCDVRSTYTRFSTGDETVDYTMAPTDRIPGSTLRPAVRLWANGDSVTWFGLDREVCLTGRNAAVVGIYDALQDRFTRRQVRWCAVHGNGGGIFMQLLGSPFTMNADKEKIDLVPAAGNTFRLYLRSYSQEEPAAFAGQDFPRMMAGMLEPPVITASEARFFKPLTVSLTAPVKGEIRYTLDGSEPTAVSPLYNGPFELTATTVVKARLFAKDMPPSFTATRKFSYDYIVKTTFSRKPNTPYNVGADSILFDGERGTVDDLSRHWLGFSGAAVTTTVELAKPIDVDYVVLRYAHSPATWAFAPRRITLEFSADGQQYGDTLSVAVPFDPADQEANQPQLVELHVPVHRTGVGFIRVVPETLGQIPAWHRAKGLKPWMMMDEIEVGERVTEKE